MNVHFYFKLEDCISTFSRIYNYYEYVIIIRNLHFLLEKIINKIQHCKTVRETRRD